MRRPIAHAARAWLALVLVGAQAGNPSRAAACSQRRDARTLCLINHERAERGGPPLAWQSKLARAARRQSDAMVAERFFAHITPAGDGVGPRVAATGYLCGAASWRIGEALAWKAGPADTPADAVAAWLASPPHRRLLLDPRYRDAGVGVADGSPLTTSPAATYTVELGSRWDREPCEDRRLGRRSSVNPVRRSDETRGLDVAAEESASEHDAPARQR